MWPEHDVLRVLSYVVTGAIALYGFIDFIVDEIQLRRHRPAEVPHRRKRVGGLLFGILGLAGFVLTWRLDVLADRNEAKREQQISRLSEAQAQTERAANAVAQARIGLRDGLTALREISETAADPDVRQRVSAIVRSVSEDYERVLTEQANEYRITTATELFGLYGLPPGMDLPVNFTKVIRIIRSDNNLQRIACAFLAFRELSGTEVGMFDFASVERWCGEHPGAC